MQFSHALYIVLRYFSIHCAPDVGYNEEQQASNTWKKIMTIRLSKAEYELLAAFRYALRQFLRFSEEAARAVGIEAQQHQALLAVKGFPGRDRITISELAERLQIRHHSAVGM